MEYLGEHAEITHSEDDDLEGIEGVIIKETKNTFTIRTRDGDKQVTKKICTFNINDHNIHGENITKKPEERIKIKR